MGAAGFGCLLFSGTRLPSGGVSSTTVGIGISVCGIVDAQLSLAADDNSSKSMLRFACGGLITNLRLIDRDEQGVGSDSLLTTGPLEEDVDTTDAGDPDDEDEVETAYKDDPDNAEDVIGDVASRLFLKIVSRILPTSRTIAELLWVSSS